MDRHFAGWLRKQGRPVILVANKCEGGAGSNGVAEAYGLGFGEPLPVSAEHGEGLYNLAEALVAQIGNADRKSVGRERVCQSVLISVVAVGLKKKNKDKKA